MEGERVLITGISGFLGSHLAEFLLERGSGGIWYDKMEK